MAVMMASLFSTAEGETKTTALLASASEARLGVNAALQIVQGHLREAATSGIAADGKGTHTWASQPGAVRVFDDKGEEIRFYKLYSSHRMKEPNGGFLKTQPNIDLPATWRNRKDEYTDLNEPVSRNGQWVYPIASPEALGVVAGFTSTLEASTEAPPPWDERLAMPVRWLYMDEQGQITEDPTVGDPVLRFAFWTDDESSKVNVNTASAGSEESVWDIPRTLHLNERNLQGYRQPSQNEFNRYPGHPATVNLRTIFPSSSIESLINASPRYQWGGSQNGTIAIPPLAVRTEIDNAPKQSRVYATVDEYLYTPNRATQLGLTPQALDIRRFFLTANSRSSELNLFGQPRVTIWPVHANTDDNHRTPYDQLIAFNSTLSSHRRYYFERQNPLSQTDDWTRLPRNQSLFAYLQQLTGREIPGFGGNFLDKYDQDNNGVSGERDQILTAIFDYIRCINLNETWQGKPPSFTSYTTDATSYGALDTPTSTSKGLGWVLPIEISSLGTRGAGRVPVISEVGLWLIQTRSRVLDAKGEPTGELTDPPTPEVQPGLLIETFTPMQGMAPWIPDAFSYQVRNIAAPTINGQALFPDGETPPFNRHPGSEHARGQSVGGTDGFAWTRHADGNSFNAYPFHTRKANAIKVTPPDVEIVGGEIEITFKSQGVPFQTTRIRIPDMKVPIPAPTDLNPNEPLEVRNGYSGWASRKLTGGTPPVFLPEDVVRGIAQRDGDFRISAYLQNVPASFFLPQEGYDDDKAWRVHGFRDGFDRAFLDTRNGSYVQAMASPPPHRPNASNPNVSYLPNPKIRLGISNLLAMGWEGDFDNGIARSIDGPFLNKTDEGSQRPSTGSQMDLASNPPYYFERWVNASGFFSPLRQIPSAIMFGSLPTGVKRTLDAYENNRPEDARPWRTLNFCPFPLAGNAHYGLSDPPDWLLADLFTMPVVEPLALSEPFSTAGRVNLNHRLAPFTYIERTTALHAVLSTQRLIAIANGDAATYKGNINTSGYPIYASGSIRYPLNIRETLLAMDGYLAAQEQAVFRSATEFCGVPLVPATGSPAITSTTVGAWWQQYQLTGNNSRERPYASIYPLLTTRSNTYQMHVRVQAIQRSKAAGRLNVRGEYRGAVLFERTLDPHDRRFAAAEGETEMKIDPDAVSLEPYFKFRTLLFKSFEP